MGKTRNDLFKKMHRQGLPNEYRHVMQVRALGEQDENEDKMIIEGKAVTFNEETVLFKFGGVEYKEIIEDSAFENTDFNDAFLKYNHSDDIMAMARYKNGTLEIDVRSDGVYIKAELADTTAGRDLYTLVKRGDIDKMSFAFTIEEESFNESESTWTVHKIDKLYDVAAVTVPAYENTDLYARRFDEVEAHRRQEAEASELARKRRAAELEFELDQALNKY
jgi:HK97 family phage prohead protease